MKNANDNPWYCLATLHGEQPVGHLDQELADKNRVAWEHWISSGTNPQQHQESVRIFAERTRPRSLILPKPATPADFSHTRFDRPVNFADFRFPWPADFRSATFSDETSFKNAQFNNKADFSSAVFCGETKFNSAQFHSVEVDFQSTTFSGGVDFGYASFTRANFRSATFSGSANFNNAKFVVSANFHAAVFSGAVDFGRVDFVRGADANFSSATFSDTASFNAATFNIASFEPATFSKSIHFINTQFNGSTTFADTRFGIRPPDFRGAKMHEATEWHGVTWPKPPQNEKDAQQQVYAYERLKQEMERLKKHEDEQQFFRRELRARRGLLRPGEWLLNFLYELLSDYGNSFYRPLISLLVVFLSGIGIFVSAPLYCGAPMPIKLATKLSFANIFVFLPDRRDIMLKMGGCLSNTTQAVSAAQSLLGVVLLFLLGLALRNRFRMR